MFEIEVNQFINEISNNDNLDEWYLSRFIDDNVRTLTTQDAFYQSNIILRKIRNDIFFDHLYELLEILIALRMHSNTNEIPLILIEDPTIFDKIEKHRIEDYILLPIRKLKKIFYLN